MGCTQRSYGSWRAQLKIDGKRHGKTLNTKTDALTWLRKMQFQLDHGFDIQGGKLALGEYLVQWLEGYKVAIRPTTYHRYRGLVDKYIIPHIGNLILLIYCVFTFTASWQSVNNLHNSDSKTCYFLIKFPKFPFAENPNPLYNKIMFIIFLNPLEWGNL